MKLNSNSTHLNISDTTLFEKLCVIENFKLIMPENISKFEILNQSTLIFSLKGMPSIKLIFGEKQSPSLITLNSSESKINFSLTAHIKKSDDNSCEFSLEFNGNLNPMIQMMVKTPLQSFINDLSKNTSKLTL
ncbi:MAG: SRPBCC family protein [Flavobacteriaceae bacterium]|nr:SRPBCC family protein [Flavobacteriaceae bacterium]